jgi:hypothetical protein
MAGPLQLLRILSLMICGHLIWAHGHGSSLSAAASEHPSSLTCKSACSYSGPSQLTVRIVHGLGRCIL